MKLEALNKEVEKEQQEAEAELKKQNKNVKEEELCELVTKRLQDRGIRTAQLMVDDVDEQEETEISRKIAECTTLPEVKKMLEQHKPGARGGAQKRLAVGRGRPARAEGPSPTSSVSASARKSGDGDRKMDRKKKSSKSEALECEDDCDDAYAKPMSKAQSARTETASISNAQVSRMMLRNAKRK